MHTGKIYGTCFRNDPDRPLVYGEMNLINPPRQRLRGEPKKEGIPVEPVIVGFCGTDHELMMMGKRGLLGPKFPEGQDRLINGHEGVVWVPSQNRFAIVLIRGGDSIDPTGTRKTKATLNTAATRRTVFSATGCMSIRI